MVSRRAGRIHRYDLANDCTYWVKPETRHNMTLIYKYILKRTDERKDNRRKVYLTYSELSRGTGVNRKSVSMACILLGLMRKDPIVKIHAKTFRTKNGVQVTHKVELLRKIVAGEGEGS